MNSAAGESAERALRTSYGRLLALLASADGDIVGAEDAIADAFERALRSWPIDGVPTNPNGWLLTAARNRRRDVWKSASNRTSVPLDPEVHTRVHLDALDPDALPDKRLELMAACAHPDIERSVRTPLMLDVVLGYTAKDIARAFALPTSTLAARLGRAKKRIREANVEFALPDRTELPTRIDSIHAAVYGAFAIDWHSTGSEIREDLGGEALHLSETLCVLLPADAETHGLAALICLSTARLPSRYSDGVLIPLSEQNFHLWDQMLIDRGEEHLRRAHALVASGESALGRFQLEAAASAVHCARRHTGSTDWLALLGLHTALNDLAPTAGGQVALALVIAETEGADAALMMLDTMEGEERFQPAWAARAHLLTALGRTTQARHAYEKALSLTPDAATRRYLQDRAALLE